MLAPPFIPTPSPDQTAAGSRIFCELSGGKHMQWPDHEDKVKNKVLRRCFMRHPRQWNRKIYDGTGYTVF